MTVMRHTGGAEAATGDSRIVMSNPDEKTSRNYDIEANLTISIRYLCARERKHRSNSENIAAELRRNVFREADAKCIAG